MVCRSCMRDNPAGIKYCLHCGELLHLGGRTNDPDSEPRRRLDRIRAKRERRKAIERLADENPEMAAKVLQTWLKSE
jgi:flagellar biosynthesis/type III secretory pathway M-ring protein FliF/YscJ